MLALRIVVMVVGLALIIFGSLVALLSAHLEPNSPPIYLHSELACGLMIVGVVLALAGYIGQESAQPKPRHF